MTKPPCRFRFYRPWLSNTLVVDMIRHAREEPSYGCPMLRVLAKLGSVKASLKQWKRESGNFLSERVKAYQQAGKFTRGNRKGQLGSMRGGRPGRSSIISCSWRKSIGVIEPKLGGCVRGAATPNSSRLRAKEDRKGIPYTVCRMVIICIQLYRIFWRDRSFYKEFMKEGQASGNLQNTEYEGKSVSDEENQRLLCPVSPEEVKGAVFSLDSHTAASPYGIPNYFYQ